MLTVEVASLVFPMLKVAAISVVAIWVLWTKVLG